MKKRETPELSTDRSECDVGRQEGQVNGSPEVNKLEGWRITLEHFLRRGGWGVQRGDVLEQRVLDLSFVLHWYCDDEDGRYI